MRFLYDAVLPQNLAQEAPAGVTLDRWEGGDEPDSALIRTAADRGYRGVLFYDRDSLEQPELRRLASERDVALVAVEARDPIEAKIHLLRNLRRISRMLADHDSLLVLAREVRAYPG